MLTLALATWLWAQSDPSLLSLHAKTLCPSEEKWLAGEDLATKQERKVTRQRVADACRRMGATVEACTVLDAMVVRESDGDPCAVHVLGPGEYGLGPLGLSVGLHLSKWGEADRKVLHVPEVSAVVTVRLFRRAVRRYGAKSWLDINAVFAGRFNEIGQKTKPLGDDWVFCKRLARWDIDCMADPRGKLGKKLGTMPEPEQQRFVARLIARAMM